MIWVDNAIAGLLAIYTVGGLIRGYSQELFSLMVWAIAISVAWFFSNDFVIFVTKIFPSPSTRLAASFIAMVFITLIVGWVINLLLTDRANPKGLSIMERLGGIILGSVHGLVVAFSLVVIAGLTPLPKERWWQESHFLPPFQTLAVIFRDNIPTKLAASINYR